MKRFWVYVEMAGSNFEIGMLVIFATCLGDIFAIRRLYISGLMVLAFGDGLG